jgi:hypothetical protein
MVWKGSWDIICRCLILVLILALLTQSWLCPVAQAAATPHYHNSFEEDWRPLAVSAAVLVVVVFVALAVGNSDKQTKSTQDASAKPIDEATEPRTEPEEGPKEPANYSDMHAKPAEVTENLSKAARLDENSIQTLLTQQSPCRISFVEPKKTRPRAPVGSGGSYVPKRTRTIYGIVSESGEDSLSVVTSPGMVLVSKESVRSLESLAIVAARDEKKRKLWGPVTAGLGIIGLGLQAAYPEELPGLWLYGATFLIGGTWNLVVPSTSERELKRLTTVQSEQNKNR